MSRYDKLKQLKKQNEKLLQERFNLLGRLMLRDKHIEELRGLLDTNERIQILTEKELSKKWVIIDYLEDRQTKLIQAMG